RSKRDWSSDVCSSDLIQLVNVMKETGKPLSELADEMTIFPQVLKNINVINKHEVLSSPQIQSEIEAVEHELGDNGRVLVRPSGTESLVRVMVEAPTEQECERHANRVIDMINRILGTQN